MSEMGISGHGDTNVSKQLDIVELIADNNDWVSERRNDDEIAVQALGHWCDYSMFFAWNEQAKAIHFTCALDMRVQPENLVKTRSLLDLINNELWLGHFGIWEEEGLPMFRYALLLKGTNGASCEQIEDMVLVAIAECERFYPAFQRVIWGGKSPEDAIALSIINTVGEA